MSLANCPSSFCRAASNSPGKLTGRFCTIDNAVPIMVGMMLLADDPKVMGPFVVTRRLKALGWLATWTMAAAVVAMFVTS